MLERKGVLKDKCFVKKGNRKDIRTGVWQEMNLQGGIKVTVNKRNGSYFTLIFLRRW